jgi:transcriptional regulator with XRE-family HTH domain
VEHCPKVNPVAENSSFARRLLDLREAAGLSQYELARRAGLTRQALSLLELGEREPSWTTVQRLAAGLKVDCRSFVDENLSSPPEQPAKLRGRPRKELTDLESNKPRGKGRKEK